MSVKILKTCQTLEILKDKMDHNNKVFFIRFGDNDVYNMVGKDGFGRKLDGNVALGRNKTKYSKKLQNDLRKSFYIKDENYLRGLSGKWVKEEGMVHRVFGSRKLRKLLDYVEKIADDNVYLNPIVFHYLFVFEPGVLKEFFDNYLDGKILFVGSADGNKLFVNADQVETLDKNAYEQKDKILKKVKNKIESNKYDVVVLACGQLGRAIAHYLWEMPEQFHCIDIGSMVDAVDNKVTRRWIKKMDLKENIKLFTNGYNIANYNSQKN